MWNDKTIASCTLSDMRRGRGRTVHRREGIDVSEQIAELRIVQLEDDSGFYLFYYDALGNKLNDTYHDSISEAKEQAEFEFGVLDQDWRA